MFPGRMSLLHCNHGVINYTGLSSNFVILLSVLYFLQPRPFTNTTTPLKSHIMTTVKANGEWAGPTYFIRALSPPDYNISMYCNII